ncbi:MAG: chemotaxis protein CheX [Planctomycetota bacterium]
MPHDHTEIIQEVVPEVLEQLAFVFADPAEADELPGGLEQGFAVRVKINGAATGSLTVVSGRDICAELAANLTGDDPEDVEPESAEMALMELANVLCGQLLTRVAGVEPVFDLEAPTALDSPPEQWQALHDNEWTVAFLADDCPFLVLLELSADLAQAA